MEQVGWCVAPMFLQAYCQQHRLPHLVTVCRNRPVAVRVKGYHDPNKQDGELLHTPRWLLVLLEHGNKQRQDPTAHHKLNWPHVLHACIRDEELREAIVGSVLVCDEAPSVRGLIQSLRPDLMQELPVAVSMKRGLR
jgi:hypothetical protein